MYCSSCGVSVAQGLSYCNHCGAKLNREKGDSLIKSSGSKAESLIIAAIVAVFVFGLGAIMGLMAVMKAVLDLNIGQILAFTLLSFLIMLLIEGVFIWRLMRRNRSAEGTGDTALSKEQATKELDAAQGRVLPEAMPSVTEHTTRALEQIYSEQESK
jgi:predicted amidophosphoribosyltransferase